MVADLVADVDWPIPPRTACLGELRRLLVEARRHGEPFSTAWPQALDATIATLAFAKERTSWRHILGETSESWAAAYAGRAVAREHGLVALLDPEREATPDRPCDQCGGEVAGGAKARFCGEACRRAWHRERTLRAA